MNLRGYVQIARADHWFKNLLVLPGTALAAFVTGTPFTSYGWSLLIGLAATCLIASANYALNEWLDAEFDRHHPLKKNRPSVVGGLTRTGVTIEYVGLLSVAMVLAAWVSAWFLAVAILFAVMGVVYNARPLRTKDRAIVDVLSESFNNPIRLMLGWLIVTSWPVPPASLILGYWMLGAFLMAVKRFAEMRYLGSPELAGRYRASFQFYTEERLLISILFYACCSSFAMGIFLVKYRVELLVTLPFLALAFAWYLHIGLKTDSAAQRPERLYRERAFTLYLGFVTALICVAFVIDIPLLHWFLERAVSVGN